uniref:Exocrine gland-secreting peptide 30 n=1 Tax=Mus musculus TaxID=10090 RepID=A8R0W2_MOUSE|nr:exocrine gland-secreting peptide 30 [Mus musculus]
MASFTLMYFLIILLLPSKLTKGLVLTQTQKDVTMPADILSIFDDYQIIGDTLQDVDEILLDSQED